MYVGTNPGESMRNWNQVKINKGTNGSGNTVYVLQANRIGSKGQKIVISETFATLGEAECYRVHAL